MNLDNRVVYLNHGSFVLYHIPNSQAPQNIFQNRDYTLQQPNMVGDISRLFEGEHFVTYLAETPEIRRPPATQYDIPIPPSLIKIPRRRHPRRGPGRLPRIPPGGENDKKDKKEPPPVH